MKHQLLSDGLWIILAQASSAVGALALVRLLTELLSPEQFGSLALVLGIVTLCQGLFCTPVLQAVLRYYPDFNAKGDVSLLCSAAKGVIFRRALALSATGLVVGVVARSFLPISIEAAVLLNTFLFVEMWRSYEVSLFNPIRRQKAFAGVMVADACMRLAFAWAAAYVLGSGVEAILVAFTLASIMSALVSSTVRGKLPRVDKGRLQSPATRALIASFSQPLVPLAVVSWCNGTLDRYIIAGMLGSGHVGIYAAAYGLMSRPFIMAGHVVEQTLRPVYYEATSRNDRPLANKMFRLWIGLISLASAFGFAAVTVFAEPIARIFLGADFREGAAVMPSIAAAYGLLTVTQAAEKQFYALYQTRRVLLVEGAGLIAMLVLLPLFLLQMGIRGAAIALLAGAAVQILAVSFSILLNTRRERPPFPS